MVKLVIEERSFKPLGKKHNYVDGRGGTIIRIIIFDDSGRRIDQITCNDRVTFLEKVNFILRKFY